MTISAELNRISKLALVASDQSYLYDANGQIQVRRGDSLAELPDTPSYDFRVSYAVEPGFVVDEVGETLRTGFKFVASRNTATNEVIVAMAGTDGLDLQDWAANLKLGWDQWSAAGGGRALVLNYLGQLQESGFSGKIHFTGQSLGGVLAQYAALELFENRRTAEPNVAQRMSLTTFNGLGARDALRTYGNKPAALLVDFDTAFAGSDRVAHYHVANDLISRLGGGHIGGPEYRLDFSSERVDPKTGKPFLLDPLEAHRIETGFYREFARRSTETSGADFTLAQRWPVDPIVSTNIQPLVAELVALFNNRATTRATAEYRLKGSLIVALKDSDPADISLIVNPALDALLDSGVIGSDVYLSLKREGIAFLRAASNTSARDAGIYLLTALAMEKADINSSPSQQDIDTLRQLLGSAYMSNDLGAAFYGPGNAARMKRNMAILKGQAVVYAQNPGDREMLSRLGVTPEDVQRITLTTNPNGDGLGYYLFNRLSQGQIGDVTTIFGELAKFWAHQELRSAKATLSNFADTTAAAAQLFYDEVRARTTNLIDDVAKGIGNAFVDLSRKATGVIFDLQRTLNFQELKKFRDSISDAERREGVVPDAREMLRGARLSIEHAGEAIAADSGTGTNPFNFAGFDPQALAAEENVNEGRGRLLTLSLPYETGVGGQNVKLTLAGMNVDSLRLFVGEEVIGQSGVFTVTVPEGARQLAITLVEDGDIDADSTVTVKAQLVDAAGNATHVEHEEATLTVRGRTEQAPEITLSGGDGIDVFIQSDDQYAGKRAGLSGGANRDLIGGAVLEDIIDGGEGDDILLGAGGPDAILGGTGNDFIALSVGGAANIDGGAGDDIVDARRVIDFQVREADLSLLTGFGTGTYAAVMKDVLANLRVAEQGDVRGGRVGNAPGGLPYLISFSPSTFSGVSPGVGLDESGEFALKAGGGAAFSLAVRPDGQGWNVTYTAGGNIRTFALLAGEFAGPQNAEGASIDGGLGRDRLIGSLGADLIRGGDEDDAIAGHTGDDVLMGEAGADTLFGGEGEDFVDGGVGNDALIGEAGDDALAGADGNDTIEGDSSDTPVAEQGNDLLRGDAGNDVLLGWGGDDQLVGGAGTDQLSGGEGSDALYGGTENDTLAGGAGDDHLDGGSGADTIAGDAGNDNARGGEGADLIAGGAGDDVLEGDAGVDQLQGGEGRDVLFGGADNDILFGEGGDDQLAGEDGVDQITGGAGSDVLYGGIGGDTYFYRRGDAADRIIDTAGEGNVLRFDSAIDGTPISFGLGSLVIRVAGTAGDEIHLEGFDPSDALGSLAIDYFEFWNGSSWNRQTAASFLAQKGINIAGTAASETIEGTSIRDIILAGSGDDRIEALEGNDILDGGAGADVLIGGPGDDNYKVDDPADQVIEFAGEGTDTVEALFSYSLEGTAAENLTLQGSAVEGTGNELNNNIRGNSTANVLLGDAGSDFLRGEDDSDVLDGGSGNDGLQGGRGADRLAGGAGDDGLSGGLGNDTYVFGPDGGSDSIADVDVAFDGFFGSGIDTLELNASPSDVRIARTLGDARLSFPATSASIDIRDQYLRHQQGQFVYRIEQIRFADGVDRPFDDYVTPVAATPLVDTLFGGSRSDRMIGLNGADTLHGMGGDDILEGGVGSDVLSGGDGNDVYLWGRGAGHDTIDDFDTSKFHIDSPFDVPLFYTGFSYGFSHSAGEVDTVQIDAILNPSDIRVTRDTSNYFLDIRDSCERLTLANWGSDFALRPEFQKSARTLEVRFADGTVWGVAELDALVEPTEPTEGNDVIQGTPRDDLVLALGGNDSLFGFAGDDTLDGGAGNDTLDGGSGSDTYLFGRGSGTDAVTAGDNGAGAIDRILFATDVTPADVVVRQSQTEFAALTLSIADSGDAITVRDHFTLPVDARLDIVEFADGTVWDKQALLVQSVTGTDSADSMFSWGAGAVMEGRGGNDALFGSNTAETLLGGAGNDFIRDAGGVDHIDGGPGDDRVEAQDFVAGDTIAFGFGSGRDVVNGAHQDIIVMAAGVTPDDVKLVEGDTYLRLELSATGDALTVNGWRNILSFFGSPSLSYTGALKEVRFADGTVWNQSALLSRAVSGMVGTAGPDTLYGTNNTDTLEGFAGNDTLNGFNGVDVYRFDRGYGTDTVVDSFDFSRNAGNLIRLGAGLVPSATFVVQEGNNTALEFGGGDKLIVRNGISVSPFSNITALEFADGTVWNTTTIVGMARTAVPGGTSGANTLSGTDSSEYIDAREGADTIFANGGNDVIVGGVGNDSLFGGAGSDVYFAAPGFGSDTLSDVGVAGDIDAVRFAPEVAPADIAVTRDPSGNVYVVRTGSADRLVFAPSDIERVEFADGTLWDAAQLQAMARLLPGTSFDDLLFGTPGDDAIDGLGGNDLIRGAGGNDVLNAGEGNDASVEGGEGNDTISGGAGSDALFGGPGEDVLDGGSGVDTLVGGEGSDSFVLARGNGEDVISQLDTTLPYVDTLAVQTLPSEVRASRDENHLYVSISGGDARAKLDGWFAATATDANRIDQVRFADGTTWDRPQLLANLTYTEPTTGNDRIFGLDNAETIFALAGNDVVLGRGGNDTLDGGPGSDVLDGGDGANVYLFDRGGDADRVVTLNDGLVDTLRLGPGLTPADVRLTVLSPASANLVLNLIGSTERVTIQNGYADAVAGRHTIQVGFADGTIWSADSLRTRADIMEPPALVTPLPDHSVLQDQLFEYHIPLGTFSDPDAGDRVMLAASQVPGWLSFDGATGTFRGTPTLNDVTTSSILVTATDTSGQAVGDVFLLTVVNVNDAPVVDVPLSDLSAVAGTSFSRTFQSFAFRDPDPGASLTYSAALGDGSVLPPWLTFSPQLRRFDGNPSVEDVGQFQVRVTATDPLGAAASDVFLLNISPPPPTVTADGNHSPVLVQQIPDQMVLVGTRFDFAIPQDTFVDEDVEHEHAEFCGDVLAYQVTLANGSPLPGWLQFDPATLTFSGTPGASDVGDLSVRVLAYDTNAASARETFLLKVQSAMTNRPPFAMPIEDQEALEDAAFAFMVPAGAFSDSDADDVLALSASLADGSALPAWLQFDATAGSFSGTPSNEDVGQLSIRLTATDLASESASSEFDLSVLNVNDAPILVAPFADQAALINSSFFFAVPAGTFIDVDMGDVLSLSASLSNGSALPAWLSFDPAAASFSGLAGYDEEGAYSIRLTATDKSGASTGDEFQLDVICTEGVTRTGTSGADTLRGTNCDDVLDGAAGVDTLIGKRGNDLYFVDTTLVRDPQGNEGVGNGEDPPPPGHEANQNDGPGTGPGNPGSAGGDATRAGEQEWRAELAQRSRYGRRGAGGRVRHHGRQLVLHAAGQRRSAAPRRIECHRRHGQCAGQRHPR